MIKRSGYNENKARRIAEKYGTRHGEKHIEYSADAVIKRIIKTRPADTEADKQFSQYLAATAPHPDRVAWAAELHTTQREQTKQAPRWMLRTAAVGLVLVEFTGISGLLASQNFHNPQRSIVAIGGALILTYLTKKAATTEAA
jgi:hypothetical protein